jgi:hypothetical protein
MADFEDFNLGDFVICNFPFESAPAKPADVRHFAFCVGIYDPKIGSGVARRLVPASGLFVGLYTSSKIGKFVENIPPGVLPVSTFRAQSMGQDTSFFLDVRRRAWMPITTEWFPRLKEPDHGRIGRADRKLMADVRAQMRVIAERYPEQIVNLGPFAPR